MASRTDNICPHSAGFLAGETAFHDTITTSWAPGRIEHVTTNYKRQRRKWWSTCFVVLRGSLTSASYIFAEDCALLCCWLLKSG